MKTKLFIKNKKADMLVPEEVLKLVLAVISIAFLIILSISLYGLFTKKTDLEQARVSLKEIAIKINSFKDSDKTQEDYLIMSPEEWYLTSHNSKLCLCATEFFSDNRENCCNKGANENIIVNFKIDSSCTTRGIMDALTFSDYHKECLEFYQLPFSLDMTNLDGIIHLRGSGSSYLSLDVLPAILQYKEEKTTQELIEAYIKYDSKENKATLTKQINNYFKNKENWYLSIIGIDSNGKKINLNADELVIMLDKTKTSSGLQLEFEGYKYTLTINHKLKPEFDSSKK